mmetsp:Transcript_101975/g.286553  ORF Transcript_101975/g.286553 Transcript_101975/m.286553 type:complete len:265 (-) Transcript_101975:121-915(-)
MLSEQHNEQGHLGQRLQLGAEAASNLHHRCPLGSTALIRGFASRFCTDDRTSVTLQLGEQTGMRSVAADHPHSSLRQKDTEVLSGKETCIGIAILRQIAGLPRYVMHTLACPTVEAPKVQTQSLQRLANMARSTTEGYTAFSRNIPSADDQDGQAICVWWVQAATPASRDPSSKSFWNKCHQCHLALGDTSDEPLLRRSHVLHQQSHRFFYAGSRARHLHQLLVISVRDLDPGTRKNLNLLDASAATADELAAAFSRYEQAQHS